MIISKSSWHYRWFYWLVCKFDWKYRWEEPKNLCSYFWRFVGTNLYGLFVLTLISGAIALLPILFWSAFHNHSPNAKATLIFIGCMALVLVGFVAIAIAVGGASTLIDRESKKGTSFIGVAWNTLKAGKNKVCPTITYRS